MPGRWSRHRRLFRFTAAFAVQATLVGVAGTGVVLTGAAPAVAAAPRVATVQAATSAGADVTSRPDLVSARLAARAAGHRVEVTDLDTADTTTYVNPDGTLTSILYSGPVRVRQGSGWASIDTSLAGNSDGSFSPKAAELAARLSGGGSGDSAVLTSAGDSVGLGLPAAALPKPTVTGSTLTYPNVEPGIDVIETMRDDGMEYSLRLDTRPTAPVSFTIPLDLTGLTVSQDTTTGVLHFKDASGKTVFDSSVPTMYGAAIDPHSDLPAYSEQLTTKLTTTGGRPAVMITPDFTFLSDPAVTYPVTVDPSTTLGLHAATYVSKEYPTSAYYDASELRVGTYNSGTDADRAFWWFHTSPIIGKYVTSATLQVYEDWSYSCTPEQVNLWEMNAFFSTSTDWNNQPGGAKLWTSLSAAKGYDSSCPAGNLEFDVTGLMQKYSGISTDGVDIGLSAASETNDEYWKKFQTTTNLQLSVTYDSYPNTPTNLSPAANSYYGSTTANLSAKVTDPDGGNVEGIYYVQDVTTGDSWVANGGGGSWVASGGTTTFSHAGLTNGDKYQWELKAYDGTVNSGYTGWQDFTVDTTVNPAPTITSTEYTNGEWYASAGSGSNDFSWSDTSTDVSAWQYQEDAGNWTTTSATSLTWNPAAQGLHTLSVRALNKAGVAGSTSSLQFGIGSGTLTSPADQDRTQKYVPLISTAADPTAQPYVWYRYRIGTTGTLNDIPTGDTLNPSGGSGPQSSPVQASSYPSGLVWDVAKTAGTADALLQVQACFYASASDPSPSCTDPVTVQLDGGSFAGSYATKTLGPGTLSLLTGDFSVSASDVNVTSGASALTVGRTLTTLVPATGTGGNGIFGPGWTPNLPSAAGDADLTLSDQTATAGYVTLTGPDGTQLLYTADGTSYPISYTGVGDAADGSQLVKVSSTEFTLTDTDGTVTTWTSGDGGASFQASSVTDPGGGGDTTSYNYTTLTVPGSNVPAGLPYQIVDAPAGVSCSTPLATVGCRTLTINYATATTATGTTQATWGNYQNQVESVSLTAADPANNNSMTTSTVADYLYDNTGHLRGEYDPRITPNLQTTYAYDGNGRLVTLTPPGVNQWNFTYLSGQTDADLNGRLATVSRNDPAGGSDVTNVVYDVATSGTSAPINLSQSAAESWNQTDLPVTGTAVFPASHPVTASYDSSGNLSGGVAATDWPYASITYPDVNGRPVDQAGYGAGGAWQVSSTNYDSYGNVTSTLSAQGRDEALDPSAYQGIMDPTAADQPTSAEAAQLLSTVNTYQDAAANLPESELKQTLGPIHPVILDGTTSTVDARTETDTSYDSGEPAGGPYQLPTSVTVSAVTPDGVLHDSITTEDGYAAIDTGDTTGWTLRQPTTVTTVMGGSNPDIVKTTRYNSAGQVIETRQPNDTAGTTAGTTLTSYYTATGSGPCVDAAMAGLPCQTSPAAQPTSGPPLPTTTTNYNILDQPVTVTAAEPGYGTTPATTRTTTTGYDPAGRETSLAVAVSPSGAAGAETPTVSYSYDQYSGLPTTTTNTLNSATIGTITVGYDADGRQNSYTDAYTAGNGYTASSNSSSQTYDANGDVATLNDGKGSVSYTYDNAYEHRGLLTSLVDSAAGTFTSSYDGDGNMTAEDYPNGLTATRAYDDAGNPTSLVYALAGTTWGTFSDTYTSHDQVAAAPTPGSIETYSYDNAGRLIQAQDQDQTVNPAVCTTRVYSYDLDSNRSSVASYPPDATGACSTSTTATTTSYTHDQADRTTNTGYSYDQFGRTTALPASDISNSAATTLGYYTNDMAYSETQGNTEDQWVLDPAGRQAIQQDGTTNGTTFTPTSTTTNYYTDDGDSPAWQANSDGTWTRNIEGPDGNLAAIQDQTGAVTLQLTDLHGDIVATAANSGSDPGWSAYFESTEFGIPRTSNPANPQYAWLGGKRRSADSLGGLVLMGQRLYNPTTGRFLQTDPVPGASATSYDYAEQDPINGTDLSGEWPDPHVIHTWATWGWNEFQRWAAGRGSKFPDRPVSAEAQTYYRKVTYARSYRYKFRRFYRRIFRSSGGGGESEGGGIPAEPGFREGPEFHD